MLKRQERERKIDLEQTLLDKIQVMEWNNQEIQQEIKYLKKTDIEQRQ